MNGAAAVLDSRIKVPRSSMTITIGSSHHFLFCARNDQNSLSKLSLWDSAAAFSNSPGIFGLRSLIVFVRQWGSPVVTSSEQFGEATRAGRFSLGGQNNLRAG